MKRVLITGANSYVGTSVEKWLMKEPDKYCVETLDMKDPNWVNLDFSKFDVVFHVAGIAHIRETKKNKTLYYKINKDLAIATAIKSKESGIKHFIFMSSMSVYGVQNGNINYSTPILPKTYYGKSKYDAEKDILLLNEKRFTVAILRPPMIYGYNCPGNYSKLSKISKYLILIPKIANYRSMIFIDNLCTFVEQVIAMNFSGVYMPQNSYYVNTSHLIAMIRSHNSRKIRFSLLLGLVMKLFKFSKTYKKIFGNLTYDFSFNQDHKSINEVNFEDSIKRSEGK